MPITMRCRHLKHKGETWTLELGEKQAEIRDAAGQVRGEYLRDEAPEELLLPSFSESIKQFRAAIDGELWYFHVAREDLKQIKSYLDQSVVASGPEAVQAVRHRAIRDTVIGIGAIVVGVALTVMSYVRAAQNPAGGSYVVTWGAVLFGCVALGNGLYGLRRHAQLQNPSK